MVSVLTVSCRRVFFVRSTVVRDKQCNCDIFMLQVLLWTNISISMRLIESLLFRWWGDFTRFSKMVGVAERTGAKGNRKNAGRRKMDLQFELDIVVIVLSLSSFIFRLR